MNRTIGIVGLGLIGGSFAKAIKSTRPELCVLGYDRDNQTMKAALCEGIIAAPLNPRSLAGCHTLILALYPDAIERYARDNLQYLPNGTVVTDLCGIKGEVASFLSTQCKTYGLFYLGAHPMAGKERWGYAFADAGLFRGASMILTPAPDVPETEISWFHDLCIDVGFSRTVQTTPEDHDRIIAYTSQLAHIVSGAYMKSPTAAEHDGFSAGSYRDLTRVAKLNEDMWTELFLANRNNLSWEIQEVISHLREYQQALDQNDANRLKKLLAEGRQRKETLG